ncbi:hypothetical protein GGR04_000548 [Aureimonas pseudogalii]|uniref:Uncharacterized protein n=1 Tax=Aureimonas pseudogalii TaxID=1744844 RepID=A0A7W6E8J3_9HYPH|nr:hypothetical protein [Aureimonas pseudogalii]
MTLIQAIDMVDLILASGPGPRSQAGQMTAPSDGD